MASDTSPAQRGAGSLQGDLPGGSGAAVAPVTKLGRGRGRDGCELRRGGRTGPHARPDRRRPRPRPVRRLGVPDSLSLCRERSGCAHGRAPCARESGGSSAREAQQGDPRRAAARGSLARRRRVLLGGPPYDVRGSVGGHAARRNDRSTVRRPPRSRIRRARRGSGAARGGRGGRAAGASSDGSPAESTARPSRRWAC